MTKQIAQIKKISKSLENTILRNLSIQFSLDGFSFCIKNQQQETIDFVAYDFDKKIENPTELLTKIEEVFSSEKLLQQDFASVLAIHQNDLYTIVPNDFFDENSLQEYLKYTIKILKTDFIAFDEIEIINAKNVYIPYININNYLFQNFGAFEYKHHVSVLIEKLLKLRSTEKKCFVNVCKTSFDVIVIENEKLIFSNRFSYHTKQDFIYYLLFVAEQLKLDLETISVEFTGEITKESDIYKIAYTYIRNVSFINNKSSFFDNQKELQQHQNYILID